MCERVAGDLLAKPTGAVCNLDCASCFFLSKEMLYPGSRFRMADELLETYVRQLVEAHVGAPAVEVAWQGGEPTLMGLPFFRRAVELVDTCLHPGQRAAYTIQTNGTRLDAEWAAFVREHHDVRFACHGGCPKDRFTTTPDGEPGLNYLCPSFKRFFAHVAEPMDQMARLLARGRPPSEIAGRYAGADAQRGRNTPCTCGSGRKWKHCHGTEPAPERAVTSPTRRI